jgi:hypothetical protein
VLGVRLTVSSDAAACRAASRLRSGSYHRDPDAHAARRGIPDRVRDAVTDRAREANVVECEVERFPRTRDPGHDPFGDRLRGLAAVGVSGDVEHGPGQYPGR